MPKYGDEDRIPASWAGILAGIEEEIMNNPNHIDVPITGGGDDISGPVTVRALRIEVPEAVTPEHARSVIASWATRWGLGDWEIRQVAISLEGHHVVTLFNPESEDF